MARFLIETVRNWIVPTLGSIEAKPHRMNMHKQITTGGGLSPILVTFMADRITSGYTAFKKANEAHFCRRLKMFIGTGLEKKTASECLHDHVFD